MMQAVPNESLELKLLYSIPMKQYEIDMKDKIPDASMRPIESDQEVEAKPIVPKDLTE